METQVREQEGKVKETEAITIKNAEEEDKFENKISKLQVNYGSLSFPIPVVQNSRLLSKIELKLSLCIKNLLTK